VQASRKPGSASVHEDKQRPVATFKNSLRAWQARYKKQRAIWMAFCRKAPSQAATASYEPQSQARGKEQAGTRSSRQERRAREATGCPQEEDFLSN
jgi:hypothetical protein